MEKDIEIISSGWDKVPAHLMCKTDLNQIGMKPGGDVKARVWNHHNWIDLYDKNEAKPKWKPSEKQLAALARGREKLKESLFCHIGNHSVNWHGDLSVYDGEKSCKSCITDAFEKERERERISEWHGTFKEWFSEDFVVLDTQTSGLVDAEVCEISIIDRNGSVLLDTLIKTKNSIPEEVTEIHGITNEMVSKSPTWVDVMPEIKEILSGKRVFIYNSDFDTEVMNNSCRLWDLEPIYVRGDSYESNLNEVCVMETSTEYYDYSRWESLSEASEIPTKHRSLDCCKSTLVILQRFWRHAGLID